MLILLILLKMQVEVILPPSIYDFLGSLGTLLLYEWLFWARTIYMSISIFIGCDFGDI